MKMLVFLLLAVSACSLGLSAYSLLLFQELSVGVAVTAQRTALKLSELDAASVNDRHAIVSIQTEASRQIEHVKEQISQSSETLSSVQTSLGTIGSRVATMSQAIDRLQGLLQGLTGVATPPSPADAPPIPEHGDATWTFEVTAIATVPRGDLIRQITELEGEAKAANAAADRLQQGRSRHADDVVHYRKLASDLERKANGLRVQSKKPLYLMQGKDAQSREVTCHLSERLNALVPTIAVGELLSVSGHREKMDSKVLIIRDADISQ